MTDYSEYVDLIMERVNVIKNKVIKTQHSEITEFYVPIKTVCEVACRMQLRIFYSSGEQWKHGKDQVTIKMMLSAYYVEEAHNDFMYYEEFFRADIEKTSIQNMLNELFVNKFQNLYYDTLTSKMKTKEDPFLKLTSNILQNTKNVVMKNEKCGVCLEQTNRKTMCNHALCVKCADEMLCKHYADKDSDNDEPVACPECRENDVTYNRE